MSELNKLVGKGKKIQLGEIEIEIKPLTVSSMPLLMQLDNPEQQGEAIKEMISKTIKDSIPDATDEEIGNVPLEHLSKILEALLEVNKLEVDSPSKKEFIEKLKKQ